MYENFTVRLEIRAASADSYEKLPDAEPDLETERKDGVSGEQGEAEQAEEPDERQGQQEEAPKPETTTIWVNVNGTPVMLDGKKSYVFVDVFDRIFFDLNASAGRDIVTKLNGVSAEYMQELKEGDVLEIYWEGEKKV